MEWSRWLKRKSREFANKKINCKVITRTTENKSRNKETNKQKSSTVVMESEVAEEK